MAARPEYEYAPLRKRLKTDSVGMHRKLTHWGVNPSGWTKVDQETKPLAERVVLRIG